MSTTDPSASGSPTKGEEIPLEDIDKLLATEDPEFTKELEQVRSVENNAEISIEATVVVAEDALTDEEKQIHESFLNRLRAKVRMSIYTFKLNLKSRLKSFGKSLVVFLKTKPKEYALFSLAMVKILLKKAGTPFVVFREASGLQKMMMLVLIALIVGTLWVFKSNMKGIWLPYINEPILGSFTAQADHVYDYNVRDTENFYSAFPQEIHEFLFSKMKVNLKSSAESSNPMGAFEIIVQVDSKDSAIELHDREIELSDALQRIFEEETFESLSTDLGKDRLKGRLKRELNQRLTQGWTKEINFKTFILKP